MSSCCSSCQSKSVCKDQWIYFIVAAILWAYALGTLFIPADFPLSFGALKSAFIEPSLAVIAFTVGFFGVNVAIGAIANARFNKALKTSSNEYLLTKLRNAFVACFGFVAFIRVVIFLMWMLEYTT